MIGLAKVAPGEGNVELIERPEAPVGPGQVALAVRAVGICGTDLHIEAGEYPCVPPMTIGHEVCGVVTELGEGVDPDLLGARVAVETYYATCGHCAACRDGRINMCAQRQSIGTHVDGGMAPRLVLRAINLHRVPDTLSDAAAAICEPLACVCHSLQDPPTVSAGDRVLVTGPGAMGLIAAQVARACGGDVVVQGAPRDTARLALARELGFRTVEAGAGEGPIDVDVAVECSGAAPGIADALRALRPGGQLVQMGLVGHEVTLPYDLVCFHELTITAGFASTPTSWRRAMELLDADAVVLEPLITEVVPISDWRRAFSASRAGEGVKFVLDPR